MKLLWKIAFISLLLGCESKRLTQSESYEVVDDKLSSFCQTCRSSKYNELIQNYLVWSAYRRQVSVKKQYEQYHDIVQSWLSMGPNVNKHRQLWSDSEKDFMRCFSNVEFWNQMVQLRSEETRLQLELLFNIAQQYGLLASELHVRRFPLESKDAVKQKLLSIQTLEERQSVLQDDE
ncbi:MAG: hypothetical protein IKT85_05935 [Kiritimatiellae bacterium]|nr:hypothetical protein [Kiritimatiellia bacterium]